MKTKNSLFDSLVARYYPAVYSFASRFTDDPCEAIALTRDAFNIARKQLRDVRDQTAVATVLISAGDSRGAHGRIASWYIKKFCSALAAAKRSRDHALSASCRTPQMCVTGDMSRGFRRSLRVA